MHSLLLDSHVFLWVITNDPALSKPASRLVATTRSVYVSALSLFELKAKEAAGKLQLPKNIADVIDTHNFHVLDLTNKQLTNYTIYHAKNPDPVDNALLSIAESQRFNFLTADERILALQNSYKWIIAA